ncbi:hypothetical protein Ancab_005070 [Ancistrocladus abbreviatus]
MTADPSPITRTTGPLLHSHLLRHIRRHLNHLHQPRNHSEITPQDPHLLHWRYAQFDERNFEIHGQTLFYLLILFSIILLVTLLLLYARWFFRFRHLAASTAAATTTTNATTVPPPPQQQIITVLPRPNLPARPNGLEPTIIQSLPILLHQSSATDTITESECCICLGVFEDGDKVKVLPDCQHRYHCDCVDRWLISHSNCPLCRISIRVDPPANPDLV